MNQISLIPTSIYDRSGMIRVPQMTRDFAPTPEGNPYRGSTRNNKKSQAAEHAFFEAALSLASENLEQNSVDSFT